ncbi:MAG TPA: ExeM/NucH family extracellular endonuclease [Candidatus Limnocylindrales bacterium]|nr:ExeM/NucH family extracellular endonuclease [Candidatus Limnocylindrales bacterium]
MAEHAPRRHRLASFAGLVLILGGMLPLASPAVVLADGAAQTLPFSQAWTNSGLITANDDWSGVPGVTGFLGQDITTMTGADPQTLTAESSVTNDVDVIANQTSAAITNGGVAEFELADPVLALQGSGTADAPYLLFQVVTTGSSSVNVAYNLRDIDGTADNAVQAVALQYRVGSSGAFTNVPAGFVADATTGPSLATLVTAVSATLPAAAGNQPLVQVRVITANAVGSDEWVGVDDVSITGTTDDAAPTVTASPANGAANVPVNTQVSFTFSEPVTLNAAGITLNCSVEGDVSASLAGGPTDWTLTTLPFAQADHCTLTILASAVSDTDTNDPPDTLDATFMSSFDTVAPTAHDLVINEVDYDQPSTDTAEFLELKNISSHAVDLDPYTVELVNGASGGATSYGTIDLPAVALEAGDYFVVCANAATTPNCDLDVSPDTNLLQNGAPDAIGLKVNGVLVDVLSYEGVTGAPYIEGSTGAVADTGTESGAQGLSRCPDGSDTNDNATDFILRDDTPGVRNFCPGDDAAPAVVASNPPNGAVGVARTASITLTFSEPVDLGAFTLVCGTSGSHATGIATNDLVSWTLDPTVDFAPGESCTLTIPQANVTDIDATDPPNAMNADVVITFTVINDIACGDPGVTPIHDIQGSGPTSPIAGSTASIEGIVVGDYQQAGGFSGFYVQEEDADADANAATSEGIFVFNTVTDVSVGEQVRVGGTVNEFSSAANGVTSQLTELNQVSGVVVCSTGNALPTPATISLPVTDPIEWEHVEGMRVTLAQTLTVTEVFNLGRFGEISLSGTGRLPTPTNVVAPGAAAIALEDLNDRSRVILDDGDNQQNIDPTINPQGGLSASNTLRVGDSLPAGLTAIGDQRFGAYRLQPEGPITWTHTNPRPAAPAPVGGNLRVASFNVLNFFNGNGTGLDGAAGGFPTSRGATSLFELNRQLAKEVSAITTLDADIVGLMELENDDPNTGYAAIEQLVDGLNAASAPGTYAFINTGIVGTDEIRVGLLYKPAAVTPVGDFATIDSTVDPRFIDTKNRPSLAQTFELNTTGARLTVVVNHLKSKGSDCNDVGDPDTGDGQGNCAATRTAAAQALSDWLATDPTGAGDADALLIGDMNSYAKEDPIAAFETAGFVNTIAEHIGADAYSYVFDGESGYLDHALASQTLAVQVTGVAEWHINPDEPNVLDYTTQFKTANQVTTFYAPDAYRSSDHDPVLVGIQLDASPTIDAGGPYAVVEGSSITVHATGSDPDGDALTYAWDLDGNGSFETPGQDATFSAPAGSAPLTVTIHARVSANGVSAEDSATVSIVWPFTGWLPPLSNPPVENSANAGSGIPVKFTLGGDQGLAVVADGYPRSIEYSCGAATRPLDATTPTAVTPTGGFTFDPSTGIYTYNWKTEKQWANSCRRFVLKLTDGSVHYADVHFTK